MSAVGNQPTETYADLNAILAVIRRMTVPPVKQTIKNISDSTIVAGYFATTGLKKDLVDRLIGIFISLKDKKMADQYREGRRLLEEQYGSRITISSTTTPSWRYQVPPAQASGSSGNSYAYGMASLPAKPSPYSSNPHHYLSHAVPVSSSMPGPVSFHPPRRPHFVETPFLQVKEWVGGAVICPEAPNAQQRSSAVFKLNLTSTNRDMLKLPTAVHQLRLFCTSKTSFDAALQPSHAAPVEFPITCEVKVNNKPLSINLKGKKSAAKVLAPHINKDNALYFGGQENRIELVYHNTMQKYVLSVAICEVRNADTLARRIRREKYRSKEDVLGAMKRAAEDDDIEMGDVSMGLKCPLSYMRLNTPIRSMVCTHMQCFDALSFFSINEQTPSWQCPHCFKSIKPDSLFLDGYVQDILEKVPEEEETVLVDAEGRWHTPNKKYSSANVKDSVSTHETTEQRAESVALRSDPAFRPESLLPPTPPRPTSAKPNVEIFEIDSDDEEAEEGEASPIRNNQNEKTAAETTREQFSVGDPLVSTLRNGADGVFAAQHQSHGSTSTLPSPAPPLQTRDVTEKPQNEVIDLTLSDSEDEEPVPTRRVEAAASGGWHQNGGHRHHGNSSSSSTAQNGAHEPNRSNANGHASPSVHEHSRQPRPGHAFRTSTSSQHSAPRPERRSNSHMDEDNEEVDPDESLPVIRHRKKRRNNLGVYADEDEEDAESETPFRKSTSEGLYEDERAGLTLRT